MLAPSIKIKVTILVQVVVVRFSFLFSVAHFLRITTSRVRLETPLFGAGKSAAEEFASTSLWHLGRRFHPLLKDGPPTYWF